MKTKKEKNVDNPDLKDVIQNKEQTKKLKTTKSKNVSEDKKSLDASTADLERERKNYSDYLYQNTAEFNIAELNKKSTLQEKEKFLQDALVANEEEKLAKIESFDRYDLVVNRITEHYETLHNTNSALTMKDLSVQTHLLLLPDIFVEPDKILEIISKTMKAMWDKVRHGKVVMINEHLLFDSLKFNEKVVPICVINPKLIPAKYITKFVSLDFAENFDVLNAFVKIFENALNARFYVELDDEIIVLRKGKKDEEQNQLFISKTSLRNNFENVLERERSKEVYDEINLEDVVSNKTRQVISFENSKVPASKVIVKESSVKITSVKSNGNGKTTKKVSTTKVVSKKDENKAPKVKAKKVTAKKPVKKAANTKVVKKPSRKTTTKTAKTATKKTSKTKKDK
ncbi:MAG: hypothetical protein HRT99_03820 [Mycoplasmatales bacterium]|nr:hypothetical protein [Mycoplasmatales bacterium]